MSAINMEQALQAFFAESREGLEAMEQSLLALDATRGAERDEHVNAIFRAAHTVKGSAGLFGLDRVVSFAHVVENVLDSVRAGKLAIDEPLVALLLACGDHVGALIDAAEQAGGDAPAEAAEAGLPLLAQLQERLVAGPAGPAGCGAPAAAPPPGAEGDAGPRAADAALTEHWHLSLRFGPDVLRNGMDPLGFVRFLGTLGRLHRVETVDTMPADAAAMDPETCYLGFEIALDSAASKTEIEQVFEFVRDESNIRILPPHSRVGEYLALIQGLPAEAPRLGEILVRCGTITPRELQAALAEQALSARPIGEILVAQGRVLPQLVEAAVGRQQQLREARGAGGDTRSVRVDADKLDRLIDLVGELVIAAAGAGIAARAVRSAELEEAHSTLAGLVQGVRDSALALRMVKIGATFGRFQRVVHDVSRELGKDIALQVSGEDTELDKTVVERIADPLTHLVRNAMDHGIEPADVRLANGKPAQGTLRLNAYHDSGSIVIEVGDDGGGLKRERILAKAVERGLVEPGRVLSDAEVHALIFEPGFSTAEQVTNLSGRGVGMDVVRRNIEALRGSVHIASEDGAGTTISVRLPLTLAIINGFQVQVGDDVFVVPLEMVDECVAHADADALDYADLRGEVLPLVRLREFFQVDGPVGARQNIVVVRHAGQKAGLVVDKLLGEFQTVIKPLARMFGSVRGISGSSIRGSGEVALIVDVPALLLRAASHQPILSSTHS